MVHNSCSPRITTRDQFEMMVKLTEIKHEIQLTADNEYDDA